MGGHHSHPRAPHSDAPKFASNEHVPAVPERKDPLPADVWMLIIDYLRPFDYHTARYVCRAWRALVEQYLASPRHNMTLHLRHRRLPQLLSQGSELVLILGFARDGNLYIVQNEVAKHWALAIYDRNFALLSSRAITGLEGDKWHSWTLSGGALSVDGKEALLVVYKTFPKKVAQAQYFTAVLEVETMRLHAPQSAHYESHNPAPSAVVFTSQAAAINPLNSYHSAVALVANRPALAFVRHPACSIAAREDGSNIAVIAPSRADSNSDSLYVSRYPPIEGKNGTLLTNADENNLPALFSIHYGFLCVVNMIDNTLVLRRRDSTVYRIELGGDASSQKWACASTYVRRDGLIIVAQYYGQQVLVID